MPSEWDKWANILDITNRIQDIVENVPYVRYDPARQPIPGRPR